MRRFIVFGLALLAGLCAPQAGNAPNKEEKKAKEAASGTLKLVITVRDPGQGGSFVAWAVSDSQSCNPVRFTSGSATLALERKVGKDVAVFVTDEKSQKTAARVLEKFEPGANLVSFAKAEFTVFPKVMLDFGALPGGQVEVSQKENPLLDEESPLKLFLTPADGGKLAVKNVLQAGDFKVKLTYGEGKEKSETFAIKPDAKPDTLTFTMIPEGFVRKAASGAAESEPKGAATGDAAPETPPAAPSGTNPLGTLLAVAVVVAAVYFGYRYLRQKGVTLDSALGKLGVQLPDQNAQQAGSLSPTPAAQAPLVPEGHCPFCGQPKDAAGNCACQVGAAMAGVGTLAPGGSPKLIGLGGSVLSQIFPVSGEVSIGREPGNTISLPQDTTASRRHAVISSATGAAILRDLGSSNGTFVNGQRVTERQLIPGDEIVVGSTRFRYDIS